MSEPTHAVFNQVPPPVDYNLYDTDPGLRAAVTREGGAAAHAVLAALGAQLGSAASFELGRLANQYPPVWHGFDAQGRRLDRGEFHPAWHELLRGMIGHGFHSGPWAEPAPGAHVARAAGYLLQGQVEAGSLCPVTMTFGATGLLRREPAAAAWLPLLYSREYDARDLPAPAKRGVLIGMGMTEKQGGSDVRANTTRAVRQHDDSYRITGHKWFFSAPQADAHLVLAQAEAGLSCFLVPRWLPDATRNSVRVQRLKDKLGNRSNPSAEVEFEDAWGQLIGPEGRGVATIIEMASYTRQDCVLGSAALLRQALVLALHHARGRHAFGEALVAQPLMAAVLADLALESQAATALALRIARCLDHADSASERAWFRVMTAAGKFWVCKRAPGLVAEAMEVLGGNGYVEESRVARLYREAPVNSIWEGSGNIMCLDVLRSLRRVAGARDAVLATLEAARGQDRHYDAAFERCAARLAPSAGAAAAAAGGDAAADEAEARVVVQDLVLLAQASLLLAGPCSATAALFCSSRLVHGAPAVAGALPRGHDLAAVLAHALPPL